MADTHSVMRVAVVLFEDFTVLDVYGPVQAFGAARLTRPDGTVHRLFEIFTIADAPGAVKSGQGPSSHADYAFEDAPPYDILLVPGGFGTRKVVDDDAFLKRLRAASERATVTTTVCPAPGFSRAPASWMAARPRRTRSRGTGPSGRARVCCGSGRHAGSTTAIW